MSQLDTSNTSKRTGEGPDFKDQIRHSNRFQGINRDPLSDIEQFQPANGGLHGDPILIAEPVEALNGDAEKSMHQTRRWKAFIVIVVIITLSIIGATVGIVCSRGVCSSGEEDGDTVLPDVVPDFCGNGRIGDGICESPSDCCSEFGFCGSTIEHCGTNISCGGGTIGNGICQDPSLCCSAFGFCGTGPEFCDQSQFCGNGVPGNGECADPSLCCSEFYFCGTGEEFCGTV